MTGAPPDVGVIPRALELPRSQDYAALRRRGLRHIERLASANWTDYNVHDPGITILELVCYALTDLGVRAAYPMRDLLAPPPSAGTAPASRDFHLAQAILVSNPVSFADLRRRLIDIVGVRNAWIERHRGVTYHLDVPHETLSTDPTPGSSPIELNGLYDVYLEYEEFVADAAPAYRTRTSAGLAATGGDGDFIAASNRGLEFRAREDARLESVDVVAETPGNVVVRLLHGGEELARAERAVAAAIAETIPLGFALQAGRVYRLDATGSAVKLHRTRPASFPMPAEAGPVQILRGYTSGAPSAGRNTYYFFYNWQVAHDSAGLTKGEVRAAAIERIHAHRNLCEDPVNVCDLEREEVAVCADIELRPDASTEAVHAEILYRLHRHISPAVRFYSLDEMLARGRTVDEIFDGPLLDHGFIDAEELEAIRRKCEIRASDIVQILMDVDGVMAVKSLKLLRLSDPGHLEEWILPLSSDRFRIAVLAPWDSKLTFYKHGLPYYTNRKAVEPLFDQKKAADAEAKLKVRRRELTVPAGEWRDVGDYEPIQNELPVTYRVGRIRVSPRDPVRQALSRQLRAYLMFFEQILANALAQLEHVGDLFTWREVGFTTYFTQLVTGFEGFEDLDYAARQGHASFVEALQTIVETPARAEARRLRFLAHLAARYAEEFEEYTALMRAIGRAAFARLPAWTPGTAYAVGARVKDQGVEYECLQAHTSVAGSPPGGLPAVWRHVSRLITHKRNFLDDYPALSAGRGAGADWRWPDVATNVSGYQRRAYRLLDIEPVRRRHLAGHRFDIGDSGPPGTPAWRFELRGADGAVVFRSIACETKAAIDALLDLALRLGGDAANYVAEAAGTHALVQRCGEDETPDAIGETTAGASLADVVAYFRQYGDSEGFHLIEHILLRRRSVADPFLPVQLHDEDEGDCCPPVRDPYSFRVSIVLPAWSPRFRDMKFRRLVEDTLRRETPAHVYPRICWVNHDQMKALEVALDDWEPRLASLARDAATCAPGDDGTRTGRLPLPEPPTAADQAYASSLERLVDTLYRLTNVYPLARLHDCREVDGETPQVTLGNTNLGTL